jgi:hypothetical protein
METQAAIHPSPTPRSQASGHTRSLPHTFTRRHRVLWALGIAVTEPAHPPVGTSTDDATS